MNVLVIGKFYSEGFALHISETLESMGHKVGRFEPGFKGFAEKNSKLIYRINQVRGNIYTSMDSIPKIRNLHMKELWETVAQGSYALVIVCHDFLWPEEVQRLKKLSNAKIAMWFPDHLANFGKGYFMNAPYDGLFFKDPYIVKILADVLKSPVYYLPECFNPAKHSLWPSEVIEPAYHCDITTAGNSHSWRVAFYDHLSSYNVKLWGGPAPLWMPNGALAKMHQGARVLNHEKAKAFLGAKIVVNNLHYGEVWGLNVRTFEAAGIGAFQMVDWKLVK